MSMHQHRSTNGRRMATAIAAAALIVGACSIAAIVATRRCADTSSPPIALTVASADVSPSMRGAILNILRDKRHRRLDVDISIEDTNSVVVKYGDVAPDNLTEEDCPTGQCHSPDGLCEDRVECFADPCEMNPCEGEDICVDNYCGGCFAVCSPPTKQEIMLDVDIQRRAKAVIVESSSDVVKRNSGLRHCSEYSRKKCKQSALCQWDGTANLCVYLLSAGVGSSDLSCNLKSAKRCRKDPDCELWGPNMDICITKPHEGVVGDRGSDPVQFFNSLDRCAQKAANKCKKDRKCKWRKEKCISKSSNTNEYIALAPRNGWTVDDDKESDMGIIAVGKDPDALDDDMNQGSCIADFQCEGDLVCHAASGECICNTLNNEGCALGEKCGLPPGLECLPPGCLPMCTCDYTSDAIDGSNGCPVGEVCREPCAMADGRPRCFESDEKRDCVVYDVGGSDYICRDSNGDGVIDGNDGGMGCVIRAELVGRAPEMGVTSTSVSSSTTPRLDPLHQPNLDDLLNDIDSVPLPEQDPLLLSVTDHQSVKDSMVPFSNPVAATVPNTASLPALEIATESTHSSDVFSDADSSRPEKYWPRSADVATPNGIHDCVKSSDYPRAYLDMHVNQEEVVLFDTREECCRSYPCADVDPTTVGDDSPTNSTLAKGSDPQHDPSRPEKYWPKPAEQSTSNGIHDCVKSSSYPPKYLYMHVHLQIELLFDSHDECCSAYPCADAAGTTVEHSPPTNLTMAEPSDSEHDPSRPEKYWPRSADVATPNGIHDCVKSSDYPLSYLDMHANQGEVILFDTREECCRSYPCADVDPTNDSDADATTVEYSPPTNLTMAERSDPEHDPSRPEKYWPRSADVATPNGIHDCVKSSDYPLSYLDMHANQGEVILFDTREECCRSYPCADVDPTTVGDDSPANSTLAKGSDPQHGPSRPEKYWPVPAHRATINGIHDCVKSSDYPLSYLDMHVHLQIEILFDTREECCSAYPCAYVDWTKVEYSPPPMPKNPMDLPIDELLDYWLAVVPEELLEELVDVADPLSLIMSVHCSLATWHVSPYVDNTCTNGEINPVLAALDGVTFYGSALDCCSDEFVDERCEVLDSCSVSLSFDRESTSVSSPIVPQADQDHADVDTTTGATPSLAMLPVVDTTPATLDAPNVED